MRFRRSLWSMLTMVCLVGATSVSPDAAQAAPAPSAPSPCDASTTTHPFSDPVWFPLRTPANVGCGLTNGRQYRVQVYFQRLGLRPGLRL